MNVSSTIDPLLEHEHDFAYWIEAMPDPAEYAGVHNNSLCIAPVLSAFLQVFYLHSLVVTFYYTNVFCREPGIATVPRAK